MGYRRCRRPPKLGIRREYHGASLKPLGVCYHSVSEPLGASRSLNLFKFSRNSHVDHSKTAFFLKTSGFLHFDSPESTPPDDWLFFVKNAAPGGSGRLWAALGGCGGRWAALGGSRRLWAALKTGPESSLKLKVLGVTWGSGRRWAALGGSGRLWAALGGLGRLWAALGDSGRR